MTATPGASSASFGDTPSPAGADRTDVPVKPPPSPFTGLGATFDRSLSRGLHHLVRRALGPHQTAVVRIGFAGTVLFFLLRELPHRHELYGPDSAWGWDLAHRLLQDNGAFTVLIWSDSALWFEVVYFLTIAASIGLLVGWRTRAMAVFFMIGVLSLQNRNIFVGDGGDNVIRLMAIYLVLLRCAQVWSLDARRRRLSPPGAGALRRTDPAGVALWAVCGLALAIATGGGLLGGWGWQVVLWGLWLLFGFWWIIERHWPGEPRLVCDVIANIIHNAGLFVIMAQVCIIYATAGWYKIQGSRWQDGTAVHYPMNLDYFTPFPELSERLAASGVLVMLLSYGTVMIQVAFPFALLNRRVKNVFLVVLISEHIGIAVLLGLPFFSLAMISMDMVFLPTVFLLWLGHRTGRMAGLLARLPGRAGRRWRDPPGGGAAGPDRPELPDTIPAPRAAATSPESGATQRTVPSPDPSESVPSEPVGTETSRTGRCRTEPNRTDEESL